jgi:hypothetical protein
MGKRKYRSRDTYHAHVTFVSLPQTERIVCPSCHEKRRRDAELKRCSLLYVRSLLGHARTRGQREERRREEVSVTTYCGLMFTALLIVVCTGIL